MVKNFTRRSAIQSGAGFALASMLPVSLWGADSAPQMVGSKIKNDIGILRAAYMQMHPGLYRYSTPAQIEARLAVLEQDWSRDQSLASAYLSLSRFLASVKCGHTYANFYNQSEPVQQALFANIPRIPFLFLWIKGQMVITANQSENAALVAGMVVTHINGVPTKTILKRLIPYVRADGSNDAKRAALLGLRGQDDWETFDIFFNLLYPGASEYVLRITGVEGQRSTVQLGPASLEKRRSAKRVANDSRSNDAIWRIDYRSGGTAILTMPSWGLYDSKWDWEAYLDASFAEIRTRNIKALIVDIRDNEGGLDCGNAVIARLIDKPLVLEAVERRVRYRSAPVALKPYLNTWDPSFATLGEGAGVLPGGFFRLDSGPANNIAPKGPRFSGKMIVLTNAEISSATFQFVNIVKSYGLGSIIGETTGGNRRGINGGSFYFLRLPNSGMEADLPLVGFYRTAPQPDAGIVPDIPVDLTARDIAMGRDPVMDRALQVAQG
jgi:C-terminal processing protease CtpA/Prc